MTEIGGESGIHRERHELRKQKTMRWSGSPRNRSSGRRGRVPDHGRGVPDDLDPCPGEARLSRAISSSSARPRKTWFAPTVFGCRGRSRARRQDARTAAPRSRRPPAPPRPAVWPARSSDRSHIDGTGTPPRASRKRNGIRPVLRQRPRGVLTLSDRIRDHLVHAHPSASRRVGSMST